MQVIDPYCGALEYQTVGVRRVLDHWPAQGTGVKKGDYTTDGLMSGAHSAAMCTRACVFMVRQLAQSQRAE